MSKKWFKKLLVLLAAVVLLAGCPEIADLLNPDGHTDTVVDDGSGDNTGDNIDGGDDLPDLADIPLFEVQQVETLSSHSLAVTWNISPGVNSFHVYRSCPGIGQNTYIQIASDVTESPFIDTGLLPDKIYYYKVIAAVTDDAGILNTLLNLEGTGDFPGWTEPLSEYAIATPPANLRVTEVYYDYITLAWDAVEDAEYYRLGIPVPDKEEYGILDLVIDGTTYKVEQLLADLIKPETTYSFKVTAVKPITVEGEEREGYSAFSNSVEVTTIQRDFTLTVESTANGTVDTPGEGTFDVVRDDSVLLIARKDDKREFEGWSHSSSVQLGDNTPATTAVVTGTGAWVKAHFYDPALVFSIYDAEIDYTNTYDHDNDGYYYGPAVFKYKITLSKVTTADYFLRVYLNYLSATSKGNLPAKVLLFETDVRTHKQLSTPLYSFIADPFYIPADIAHQAAAVTIEVFQADRLNYDSRHTYTDDDDLLINVETPAEDGYSPPSPITLP